jgi:hypothetical protein
LLNFPDRETYLSNRASNVASGLKGPAELLEQVFECRASAKGAPPADTAAQ